MEAKTKFNTIDEYIACFPETTRRLLQEVRAIIKSAAPHAAEVISYNMPAFRQNGVLVYFAAAKAHIGFYPTSSPIVAFKKELEQYKTSKGAIQFPMDKPIPRALIKSIVKFRVKEDEEKAKKKKAAIKA